MVQKGQELRLGEELGGFWNQVRSNKGLKKRLGVRMEKRLISRDISEAEPK